MYSAKKVLTWIRSLNFWPELITVLLVASFRLVPHPPNFTPVGALALVGGARFRNRVSAILLPLIALFLSDLVIGFYHVMPYVYGAFILISLLGFFFRKSHEIPQLAGAVVASSLLFFFVTNFGEWLESPLYVKSFSGLLSAFIAGIPFLGNTLLGDLLFAVLAFSSYRFLELRLHPRTALNT